MSSDRARRVYHLLCVRRRQRVAALRAALRASRGEVPCIPENAPDLDGGNGYQNPAALRLLYARIARRRLVLLRVLQARAAAEAAVRGRPRQAKMYHISPTFQERQELGFFHTSYRTMRRYEPERFRNFFRVYPAEFDELLAKVEPVIGPQHVDDCTISAAEQLAVTLRYLAAGQHMKNISYLFLMAPSTVSKIIRKVCEALWEILEPEVFRPFTEEMWEDVAERFEELWQFPNCCGALDGKHCQCQRFPNSGSDYYNFKGFYSMVLLALADADYRFIWVDVGGRGRRSDGGLYERSLGQMLRDGELNLPPPRRPRNGTDALPFVFVGDDAFSLTQNFMTRFSGPFLADDKNIFNYRLSRARRVVENAFGILTARWTTLKKSIIAGERTAKAIIEACVVLHNWLILRDGGRHPDQRRYVPRRYRGEVPPPQNAPAPGRDEAEEVREKFTDYFLGPGRVPWQYDFMRWA